MKVKQVFLLSLFLVLFIPTVQAASCCVAPYSTTSSPTGGIFQLSGQSATASDCTVYGQGLEFVQDCTEPSGAIKATVSDTACCFDSQNNIVDYGASSASVPASSIYSTYCSRQGNTPQLPNSQGQCVYTSGSTNRMNKVIGSVRMNNATGYLLPGITVQAQNGLLISDVTNISGEYDLGIIPGVDNGANTFTASAASGYTTSINGVATELICQTETQTQQFSGDYGIQIVDFILQCQEVGEACVPNWQVGQWGPCVPYDGEYVKTRSVTDDNNCGILTSKPISVLTRNTPSPEGDAYDCPAQTFGSVCGDGKVEGFEQCEPDGQFKQIPGGAISTTPVQCSSIGLSGGNLGCTQDCGYDYSTCLDQCAVCDLESECGTCASCQGSPLCQNKCTNVTPQFLDHMQPGELTGNRNVLDAYKNMQFETGVFYEAGSADVTVKWNYNPSPTCFADLTGYEISICEDSGSNTCRAETTEVYFASRAHQQTVLPDVLSPNTNYCYNVCTLTTDGERNCAFEGDDPLPCFASGDLYCQSTKSPALRCASDATGQQSPTGCYVEEIQGTSYTNMSFSIVETCQLSEQCVQTPYVKGDPLQQGATCTAPANCVECNGLLGLFSSYNFETEIDVDGNIQSFYCQDLEFDPNKPSLTPSRQPEVGLCYEDQLDKSYIDAYSSCEEVTSCYDYATRDSCTQDPCFKFTNISSSQAINGCQWNNYSAELGIGVCQPKDVKDQECTRCDTDSPTGICDETMCGAYGSCFFKDEQHHNGQEQTLFNTPGTTLHTLSHQPFLPTCLPEKDMTCFFYENEQQCTGGSNTSINAVYDSAGNRIAGNNIRGESQDMYSFGTCKWVNDTSKRNDIGCYKDSDDYFAPSPLNRINYSDDCFDNGFDQQFDHKQREECLYDHTAPNTTIQLRNPVNEQIYYSNTIASYLPVYGLAELNKIAMIANDDVWSSDNLQTNVALVEKSVCEPLGCYPSASALVDSSKATQCRKAGCPLYPEYTMKNYTEDNLTSDFKSGEYALLVYSEDPARNLEEVQKEFVYLDTTGPQIVSLTESVDTFKIQGDIYRSNVTLTLEINENAFCEGKLYRTLPSSEIISGRHIANNGDKFNASYLYVEDGIYAFNYTCHDDYGNDLIGQKRLVLEANPSITNPTPQGLVVQNLSAVGNVAITTMNNATCRLDTSNVGYSQSRATFSVTGQTNHQFKITSNGPLDFQDVSSHHFLYTSCQLDNGDITEQNAGDVITFTIDKKAPTISLFTRPKSTMDWELFSLSQSNWTPQREIELRCDDSDDSTPIDQFGCKSITYCFAPPINNFNTTQCQSAIRTVNTPSVNIQLNNQVHRNLHLYFKAEDTGGNVATWQSINPKVRDITFRDPDVYFID